MSVFLPQLRLDVYLFDCLPVCSGGPGFPTGGVGPLGGGGDPQHGCFSAKNVCENQRIGSFRGDVCPARPPRSANGFSVKMVIP